MPLHRLSFKPFLLTLLVVALAAGGAMYFMGSPGNSAEASLPPAAKPAIHVEGVKAATDTLAQRLQAVGTLLANESVELRSEITGRVQEVRFKDGQSLKAGDTLFTLEDSVQKAELARAKANMSLSERNVQRYGTLSEKGFSSKMQLDEAQAQLNLAKANVQLAEANLAKTVIRAPFDGKAGIRKVSPGDYVSPGDVLVNFDQTETLRMQFTLPERYLPELKEGTGLNFTVETHPGKTFDSTVDALESRVSAQNRSIQVQAQVENKEGLLYPGQFVTVTLPIRQKEAALVVPDQALVPMGDKVFVFKVVDGKAIRTEVRTGLRANSQAEILAGVEPGDVIVTAGQQKLQDGAPVRVSDPTAVSVTRMEEEEQPVR